MGRSPDFANSERLESARVLGDRGFAVTFRHIDPLFTFDLSDPTAPRIAGELTVPGFSTSLHPVSDTQLVGVGADDPDHGYAHQSQLRVFQVAGATLVPQGAIAVPDPLDGSDFVRRGILTTGDAYAVSDDRVTVSRLSDVSTPVATALLHP